VKRDHAGSGLVRGVARWRPAADRGHRLVWARSLGLLFLLQLVVSCLPVQVSAQDLSVHAEVDRKRLTLDEQLVVRVVIEGRTRALAQPERPDLPDFESYYRGSSQNMSIVNGNVSASTTFTYLLLPKREGVLTIGSFTVNHNGRNYQTEPIQVRVSKTPQPASTDEDNGENRDLFVVAELAKDQVYVNEQLLYRFYLYRKKEKRVSNFDYAPPSFEGFWVEDLKEGEKQYHKVINGNTYVVNEVTTALFPTTSGTLKVGPARLRLMELLERRNFSFFNRGIDRVLRTEPTEVEVLPLPRSGRPADFSGSVGEDLRLTARLDKNQVELGDPVMLSLTVRGTGNVRTFAKPKLPEMTQFKSYDSDSKTQINALDEVAGTRVYEVVLVPREAGTLQVPSVKLTYFDTGQAKYRELTTKPIELVVVETERSRRMAESTPQRQQDIEILGTDIAHIRTDVPLSDDRRPLYTYGLVQVLLPVPVLALAGVLTIQRRRRRLAADVGLVRASRAQKEARKRLQRANQALKEDQPEAFYAEISKALQRYVGDKLNVSAVGMRHDDFRKHLAETGFSEDERERVVQLLEQCDAARFAPGGYTHARMEEVVREVQDLLTTLEEGWNRNKRRGHRRRGLPGGTPGIVLGFVPGISLVVLLATGGAGVARAQTQAGLASEVPGPQQILQQGHDAYEQGRFLDAVLAYEKAEELGVRNAALYYDLGNAYFKSGNLGNAIASYRRAERLAPRDDLLHANLDYVLSLREDKAVQPTWPWPFSMLRSLYGGLSLNEWFVVAVGMYVLLSLLVLLRLVMHNRPALLRAGMIASLVLLLSSLGALVGKVRSERFVRSGVVVADEIQAMSGPGTDYTQEFKLHEGTEVRIEVQRPDWLRISVGGKLRGWVPVDGVESL
jgi:tetratricopeptide (TPR) repeat protein